MTEFTIYCTKEQTEKAHKLGAPIESGNDFILHNQDDDTNCLYSTPTAEQMIGWLRTKGIKNVIHCSGDKWYNEWGYRCMYDTYEETVLSAIDASLEYLSRNGDVINNDEYVDLGLPSGTKWAKYNIGANSEEEHGNYYTFDEAVELFKSRNDKMPSKENFEELINNTNLTVTEVNGVEGMRFTSKINGNSIFVPFSGGAYEGSVDFVGDNTYVWSSSVLDSGSAWSLYCDSDGYAGVGDDDRYYGDVLRPVCGSAVEICREMVKQNRTF